jgi:hypothetical protein
MDDWKYVTLSEMKFLNELVGGESFEVARTRTIASFPKIAAADVLMKAEGTGSFFEGLFSKFREKQELISIILSADPDHPDIIKMESAEHDENSDPLDVLNTALIKQHRANLAKSIGG